MGKYMRKAKTTAEVAVKDLSLGVRTRAKTLALQRQARLPAPPPPPPQPALSGGYLQLRSRRLEKPPLVLQRHQKQGPNKDPPVQNPSFKAGSRSRVGPANSVSHVSGQEKEVNLEDREIQDNESKDLGIEGSFGENVLDFEGRERSTRESTPCSLIRDPEAIRTPGSTTRPNSSSENNRRLQNSLRRHIPTAVEMDEFFAGAEEEQQKQFIEKYNFDPVNDKPLPGRYKWEKLDP